jgi:hypothetical protein
MTSWRATDERDPARADEGRGKVAQADDQSQERKRNAGPTMQCWTLSASIQLNGRVFVAACCDGDSVVGTGVLPPIRVLACFNP